MLLLRGANAHKRASFSNLHSLLVLIGVHFVYLFIYFRFTYLRLSAVSRYFQCVYNTGNFFLLLLANAKYK